MKRFLPIYLSIGLLLLLVLPAHSQLSFTESTLNHNDLGESTSFYAVNIADVNGDGRNDLVVVESGNVLLLTNNSPSSGITPGDPDNFVTTWSLDAIYTHNKEITIPTHPDYTYNYNVYWKHLESSDSGTLLGQTGNVTLPLKSGTYRIEINGDFPGMAFEKWYNENDYFEQLFLDGLLSIEQWGAIQWETMDGAFFRAANMVLNATDIPDLSRVTSLRHMFNGAGKFSGHASMSHWDVGHITNMNGMFYSSGFDQDIGDWDVGSVTDISYMFTGTPFNQDISGWDVSNVTMMVNVFAINRVFNQDISGWDVSNVTNISNLFRGANAFNQDISGWSVSQVTNMASAFLNAKAFDQDLGDWNISNVTNMNWMLDGSGMSKANYDATLIGWAAQSGLQSNVSLGATGLEFCAGEGARQKLINDYSWNITGDVKAADCDANSVITPGDPDNFVTIWDYNPSAIVTGFTIPTHPDYAYNYNVYWENLDDQTSGTLIGQTGDASLPWSAGNYRLEINGDFPGIVLERWFQDNSLPSDQKLSASSLTSIEQWGDIKWQTMEEAFSRAKNMQLNATDTPDLSRVTSLKNMFALASKFKGHPSMADWDVGQVSNMRGMFMMTDFDQDIGNWDVGSVTDITSMFTGTPFNQDISGWDVSNVTSMLNVFALTVAFNQDISGWDVSNVTTMQSLFRGANAFNQDISTWDVSNVTDMNAAFYNATSFDQDLGDWDISNVTDMSWMLDGSGMSKANYDATLIGWAAQSGIPSNLELGATGLTFCAGAEARQKLIDEHQWSIIGDTPDCGSLLLYVKTATGKTWIILAEGSDAVQQFKQKIQDKAGYPPHTQILVYNGNNLVDGRTLTDYGIANGDTIHLTLITKLSSLYVDANVDTLASGYTGGGDSWENAIPELADALKWAREQYDSGHAGWNASEPLSIYVAVGTYRPLYSAEDGQYTTDGSVLNSFVLVPHVQLYGGFNPAAGIRTLADDRVLPDRHLTPTGTTILDGDLLGNDAPSIPVSELHTHPSRQDNARHVVISAGDVGEAVLDGFTIRNGRTEPLGLGAVMNVYSTPIYNGYNGGGLLTNYSSPKLRHLLFTANSAVGNGGALDFYRSTAPQLDHAVITGNWAEYMGGGLNSRESGLLIKNTLFFGNEALMVGGAVLGDAASLINVTMVDNHGQQMGGAVLLGDNTGSIENTIIWGNSVNGVFNEPAASIVDVTELRTTSTIAHSLVANFGGSADWKGTTAIVDGGNNLDLDPQFVSTTIGDAGFLQLSACSPGLNAGSNSMYTLQGGDPGGDLDLAGNPRVYNLAAGGIIDMGSYEFQGEQIFIEEILELDTVFVELGTEWNDISGLPTTVTAKLSDGDQVTVSLDTAYSNWTLLSPVGGSYDSGVSGNYDYAVPIVVPDGTCFVNSGALQSRVTIHVGKGKPVLTVSWDGVDVDPAEGLQLTYGEMGALAFSTSDPQGSITYAFHANDPELLLMSDLDQVQAQLVGNATLTVQQLETDHYLAATLVLPVNVSPKPITVTAADVTKVVGENDPELTYTVSPALLGSDAFTGALERLAGEEVGSYAITLGDLSAGANYTITFEPAELSITPAAITGITLADASFVYDGTARSLEIAGSLPAGASVSYANNSRTDVGTQTVTATISGGVNYQDLVLTAELTITPATRSINFPALPSKTYGDADFKPGATASTGESIQYTSSDPDVAVIVNGQIRVIGAGTTTITATVAENSNYTSRPVVTRVLTVEKASQSITFVAPQEVNRQTGSLPLNVSASSGLPVSIQVDDTQVAVVQGTTLQILRLGTVRVTASQSGNENFLPAEAVTVTVRVVDPSTDNPIRVHPALSPNGDGINEFLMIEAIRDYPNNRVTIFDRNGAVLWEASGYDNSQIVFRGVGKGGVMLPTGTYYYIVDVSDNGVPRQVKGYFVIAY